MVFPLITIVVVKVNQPLVLSDITQTGLRLVVLELGLYVINRHGKNYNLISFSHNLLLGVCSAHNIFHLVRMEQIIFYPVLMEHIIF